MTQGNYGFQEYLSNDDQQKLALLLALERPMAEFGLSDTGELYDLIQWVQLFLRQRQR